MFPNAARAAGGETMAVFTFTNSGGLNFVDNGVRTQMMQVYGLHGLVTAVSIGLDGLTHTFADDLDMLLLGPDGVRNLLFLSDSRGTDEFAGVNVDFSDSGAANLADGSIAAPIAAGTYLSTTYDDTETAANFGLSDVDIQYAGSGFASFGSAFAGADGNGAWELLVRDDDFADTGSLTSWSITISTDTAIAHLEGSGEDTVFRVDGSSPTSGTFTILGQPTVAYSEVNSFIFDGGGGYDTVLGIGANGSHLLNLTTSDFVSIEAIEFVNPGSGNYTNISINAADIGAGMLAPNAEIIGRYDFLGAERLHVYMGTVTVLDLSAMTFVEFGSLNDNVYVYGDYSNETITGTSVRDRIFGNGGNDIINSGLLHDVLFGGAGNDTLDGQGGSDNLYGESGNDILRVGNGDIADTDVLDGGTGVDTASFSGFGSAVWVDLTFVGYEAQTRDTNNVTSGTWRNLADLVSIENIVDTAFSDQLLGSTGDNIFTYTGNAGSVADVYNGRGGVDTADFSSFSSAIWVDLAFVGVEAQTRDGSTLTLGTWRNIADLTNIENIVGTFASDQLLGNDLANVFYYTGNVGNTHDIYNGRGGVDTVDFSRFSAAVWVDINYTGIEAQTRDNSGLTSGTWRNIADLTGFENITGTAYADSLAGNSLVNILVGGEGADQLRGRGGGDFFVFANGFGLDTILDWQDTGSGFEDMIDLRGVTGVHGIGDLVIAYGANATITIGSSVITLTGVTSGLDAGDFMFAFGV